MKVSPIKKNNTSFKSSYFEDYNYKYNYVRSKLEQQTEYFFRNRGNVTKIGEGVGGETFRFKDWDLNKFVIKTTKSGYSDDYKNEYDNLMKIPIDKIGGQEAIARVYDSSGRYGLISTLANGRPASLTNRYNDELLKNLFEKMFELDKAGIYHGDLNGNNILLNSSGKVKVSLWKDTKVCANLKGKYNV